MIYQIETESLFVRKLLGLLAYFRTLRMVELRREAEAPVMSKEEFFADLRVSFMEMREMQAGRMQPLDADTVMAELRKEYE